MTPRGKGTLVLAAGLYFASWGFGTHAMYPVAVGLRRTAMRLVPASMTVARMKKSLDFQL